MRIAVLTTGRQDWGILRSTCIALRESGELLLLAGGMHCEERFGSTGQALIDEGFELAEQMPWVGETEDAAAHVQAAVAVGMVGEALAKHRPDALLLVGDRFEARQLVERDHRSTGVAPPGDQHRRSPEGRLRGGNVIDVPADNDAIAAALNQALDPAYRESLPAEGPFGDGHSAARIAELIAAWKPSLIKKAV